MALAIPVFILLFWLLLSIKVLNEYERGVIFRLGSLLPQPKGPGLTLVAWPIDRMVRIALRTIVLDVPPQDVITRDNVSVKVNAVVYFRVVDPVSAVVQVENYLYATSQEAQTTLRSILGQAHLDELLSERERLGQALQTVIERRSSPPMTRSCQVPDNRSGRISDRLERLKRKRVRFDLDATTEHWGLDSQRSIHGVGDHRVRNSAADDVYAPRSASRTTTDRRARA